MERSHHQIIWLLASGRSSQEVSQVTGYSLSWIYELVRGYNRIGPDSLGDKRREHPGGKTLLDDVQQAQLWQVLQLPPTDGGLWNGRKVADWISEVVGYKVSRQRGWEYLKEMKLRRVEDNEPNVFLTLAFLLRSCRYRLNHKSRAVALWKRFSNVRLHQR